MSFYVAIRLFTLNRLPAYFYRKKWRFCREVFQFSSEHISFWTVRILELQSTLLNVGQSAAHIFDFEVCTTIKMLVNIVMILRSSRLDLECMTWNTSHRHAVYLKGKDNQNNLEASQTSWESTWTHTDSMRRVARVVQTMVTYFELEFL